MLILEAHIDGRVTRWPIRGAEVILGRDESCDVCVAAQSISRRHLKIRIDGSKIMLEDLESTNGLRVNGRTVTRAEIAPDRWFIIGAVMMTFRRGLSLISSVVDESSSGADERRRASSSPDPDSISQPKATAPHDIHDSRRFDSVGVLAEELARAEDDDQVLHALLCHVTRENGLRGALVTENLGNGWMVRAHYGELPDPGIERSLLEAVGGGIVRGEGTRLVKGESGEAMAIALGSGWLVLHPWRRSASPDPVTQLVTGLVRRWVQRAVPISPGETARYYGENRTAPPASDRFVAVAEDSRKMLAELDELAETALPILLEGESGTGKELLARRIHEKSSRSEGPYVALNCAALPRDLLEAELFGIERGVATGVAQRPGKFLLASGGTLLLDEIGDMPIDLQPKLLRALESQDIFPVGAGAPIQVDVRIVASTNSDLRDSMQTGTFRRDLYHRIAGATVRVRPLRERPEDLIPLVRRFVRDAAEMQGRRPAALGLAAARQLLAYSWPGNVRELRHVIARAVAIAKTGVIGVDELPEWYLTDRDLERGDALLGLREDFRGAREKFERLYFRQLVERCDGNLSEASRLAGLTRSHLYKKLAELGLK